jgi:exodeoxyribonuclease VII large subunit
MTTALHRRAGKVDELKRALNAVSPLDTLRRGYAIVLDADTGVVVKSAAQAQATKRFVAKLADGEIPLRHDKGS